MPPPFNFLIPLQHYRNYKCNYVSLLEKI
uniref:Uncharacterized protein n=1 Tax=Arundo donax TaxID=35708 RepID=A0A0A9A0L8_ARUDO